MGGRFTNINILTMIVNGWSGHKQKYSNHDNEWKVGTLAKNSLTMTVNGQSSQDMEGGFQNEKGRRIRFRVGKRKMGKDKTQI